MCEDWVWWGDLGWAGRRRMGFGGMPRSFNSLESIGFPSSPLHLTLPPQVVSSEDDILHASGLPEFGVKMRPHESELLLSYLTVPYLRVPLILRFFADRSRIKERPRPSHPSPSSPPHPPPPPSRHFSLPHNPHATSPSPTLLSQLHSLHRPSALSVATSPPPTCFLTRPTASLAASGRSSAAGGGRRLSVRAELLAPPRDAASL